MLNEQVPSAELMQGRRALEGITGVKILEDLKWYNSVKKWVLKCQLSHKSSNKEPVPQNTNWYIQIAPSYPWGGIHFFPCKEKGLKGTFPHQNCNVVDDNKQFPWSNGSLCLGTSVEVLGRRAYNSIEPFDAEGRLLWHAERAISWLEAAASSELLLPGEDFELPQFKTKSLSLVAFSESRRTFSKWKNSKDRYGLLELARLPGESEVLVVTKYENMNREILQDNQWGNLIENINDQQSVMGIWVLLTEIPIIDLWQAPTSWGELIDVCIGQNIDILDIIRITSGYLRDGIRHVLLLGVPTPSKVGDSPSQINWQAITLPVLSHGTKTAKGFRTNKKGYWQRDKSVVLHRTHPINWITSQNWNSKELFNRGRINNIAINSSIFQIGAGSVGSVISEQLVRAGFMELVIVDNDFLEMGNLVRHTLEMNEIRTSKVSALANRLNNVSPYANVYPIQDAFPLFKQEGVDLMEKCEVVLDCTGDDEVLFHIANYPWKYSKKFISVSLGLGGRRLFLFHAEGTRFPHEVFMEMIQPWLRSELGDYLKNGLPREGIGCWHPIFPARIDDVWLMSSIAVKWIEKIVIEPTCAPTLLIFEQDVKEDIFCGVKLIHKEVHNA